MGPCFPEGCILPAIPMMHSGSTACPASSTKMCVKWPTGTPPETSLQRQPTVCSRRSQSSDHFNNDACSAEQKSALPPGGEQRGDDDLVLHHNLFGWEDEAILLLVPVAVFLSGKHTCACQGSVVKISACVTRVPHWTQSSGHHDLPLSPRFDRHS